MVRARHRAPPHRVEERIELSGIIQTIRRDRRELRPLDHRRPRLDLPDDLELLAVASSSTDTSETRCCTGRPSRNACESAATSPTTQIRPRTRASWPAAGAVAGASAATSATAIRPVHLDLIILVSAQAAPLLDPHVSAPTGSLRTHQGGATTGTRTSQRHHAGCNRRQGSSDLIASTIAHDDDDGGGGPRRLSPAMHQSHSVRLSADTFP